MKCNDCSNFKLEKENKEKPVKGKTCGICKIDNSACDPEDDCKTGLFDKLGAI